MQPFKIIPIQFCLGNKHFLSEHGPDFCVCMLPWYNLSWFNASEAIALHNISWPQEKKIVSGHIFALFHIF